MIGMLRKTPPLKKRKAGAICPALPLRPPQASAQVAATHRNETLGHTLCCTLVVARCASTSGVATMIGMLRKTPPLKKRKAGATCPALPLRPPQAGAQVAATHQNETPPANQTRADNYNTRVQYPGIIMDVHRHAYAESSGFAVPAWGPCTVCWMRSASGRQQCGVSRSLQHTDETETKGAHTHSSSSSAHALRSTRAPREGAEQS
jgi:hypothetical protein